MRHGRPMSTPAPEPRPARLAWRDVSGFIAAALTPGLLLFAATLVSGPIDIALTFFAIASAIAFIHVVLIAMPAFALLALRGPPTVTTVLVASILVGALPVLILGAATGQPAFGPAAIFGVFGLAGGFAFALVARPPMRR